MLNISYEKFPTISLVFINDKEVNILHNINNTWNIPNNKYMKLKYVQSGYAQ